MRCQVYWMHNSQIFYEVLSSFLFVLITFPNLMIWQTSRSLEVDLMTLHIVGVPWVNFFPYEKDNWNPNNHSLCDPFPMQGIASPTTIDHIKYVGNKQSQLQSFLSICKKLLSNWNDQFGFGVHKFTKEGLHINLHACPLVNYLVS